MYEIIDFNHMLKTFFPKEVKVDINIDSVRLEANSIINQTLIFTNERFFYTILGFTQSHS